MRPWARRFERAAARYEGFDGPWFEFGEGVCECGTERRLYSPVARPELRLCALCTQAGMLAALPNTERDVDDDDESEAA